MSLTTLEITRLRNIEHAALAPGPHLNVLLGENGSGKTSVLESIYLLGRARSFRTTQPAQLVQFRKSDALITGVIECVNGLRTRIGVRLARRQREIHVDGRVLQSSAELLREFPVQIIQPASVMLLDGSPRNRRQFLDWGTFHVEPSFLDDWRRFAKALNQRNALLRHGYTPQIEPWNHEVARYGTIVAEARSRYLGLLQPFLKDTIRTFFGDCAIDVTYLPGWKAGLPLLEVIRDDTREDVRQGYTRSGPHRGDFAITIDGTPARTYLSRGQTKLLVYALLLAQANLMEGNGGSVCVLIDDAASELDPRNRRRLLELLLRRRTQCFITALHADDLQCPPTGDTTMFHVEHGRIFEGQWTLS